MSTTPDRHVHDSEYPHKSPKKSPENSPENTPADAEAPPVFDPEFLALVDGLEKTIAKAATKPVRTNSDYTADFEVFWNAYEKKGAKAAAAAEWRKAIKRADRSVIMAKVQPYVESTSNERFRFRKDAERWLKNDGWESAVVPAGQMSNGAHSPFRNYDDQNVYDEPMSGRTQ